MKNVSKATNNPRVLAVLITAAMGLSSASSYAADSDEPAYDNITVVEQVSAHGAKRLARQFLTERGFATGVGPGKAAIESVTREGDTWILQLAISDGGWTMNRNAVLYIDAESATVSEVAPERKPQLVAAQ
jgi:hypothetical protein